MGKFDLKKYLAENKLLKEEVSLDDFLKNQLTGIEDKTEGMETVEREEWLDMFGGTKNESGFDDIYNLIKKGKNSHSIDFGDFKANYALKIGDDKIIIKYKVKKDLAENKLLKENRLYPDYDDIIVLIKDKTIKNGGSEIDEAMDVMEFIGQHYGINFEFGRG